MIPAGRVGATLYAVPRELLIDNEWRAAKRERTSAAGNLATAETIAEVADVDPADGLFAVDTAHRAQEA